MSTGRLFHARGADTLNAHSPNFSLVRGITVVHCWPIVGLYSAN